MNSVLSAGFSGSWLVSSWTSSCRNSVLPSAPPAALVSGSPALDLAGSAPAALAFSADCAAVSLGNSLGGVGSDCSVVIGVTSVSPDMAAAMQSPPFLRLEYRCRHSAAHPERRLPAPVQAQRCTE